MQRRNRQQRRKAEVYRLDRIFRPDEGEELVIDGDSYHVEGSIDSLLVVSLPETTTMSAAQLAQDRIWQATGKRVLIVTHNVEFLRMTKLSAAEASRVLGEVKSGNRKRAEEYDGAGGGSGDNSLGDSGGDEVDGGGPAGGGVGEVLGDSGDPGEDPEEGEDPGGG